MAVHAGTMNIIFNGTVIGIGGPEGVGKNTVASLVAEMLRASGYGAQVDYIAFPIYSIASALTGLSIAQLQNRAVKEVPFTGGTVPYGVRNWTPRKLLRYIGTEFIRDTFDEDLCLEQVIKRNLHFLSGSRNVLVINDVRFVNEARACKAVFELVRDGCEYGGQHASDKSLFDVYDGTFTHHLVSNNDKDRPETAAEYIHDRIINNLL